ncbi:sugar phosphate isomerase/epimerase family protein [Phenylobacterium terrae]|uniref:Sugar phosphate isomerase/epimerase family protein n=1 Tax=Phenylobacterium terrae TaxID=2665495 RepID=A0ABW4N6K5_9CAUL
MYQAIWGMEGLPGIDLETRLDAALDQIVAAGFDGVGVSLARSDRAEAVARGVRERGKGFEAMGFVRAREDVARAIDRAESLGAHHLSLQIMTRLDRVGEAVALLESFEAEAARATIPVYYETHRGRLTNDLLFTCRILDALPELRLTGDLSHYPVAHEMPLPVPAGDLGRISKVLNHCWAFHGRVSGAHQIQLPFTAPQHQGWLAQHRAWWREGFASWITRSPEGGELTFMPELGPPHYAMTDANGGELGDRWTEALSLMEMARETWALALSDAADIARPCRGQIG